MILENFLEILKLDIRFQTVKFLKELKGSSEVEILHFRKECQMFVITIIEKIKEPFEI